MTNKKIPVRQCVGCGQIKEKKELLRVLHTPEDEVLIDSTGRKNGRGAYLCPDPECLKRAQKNKGLARSLKLAIPEELYAQLAKEMEAIAK